MEKQILNRPEEIKEAIPLSGGRELPLSRSLVMGILNVTPDSFSDGGEFLDFEKAVARAIEMERQGADIIDVGGESTRPGAEPVPEEAELDRVLPVIDAIRAESQIPISIDSYKAVVAEAAIEAGADIVNDISALRFDNRMAQVVSSAKVPVVLMHMKGTPQTMQAEPNYQNCMAELQEFFLERIEFCHDNGIDKSKLILDPGIGFGKRLSDNLEILSHLELLKNFSLPLMVGLSRKSFINNLHPRNSSAETRIGGSMAGAILAIQKGANIVRVHDVAETVEAIKLMEALRTSQ
ncbi:MAG TPA: dihydropteroate synthase [candidate division Zixibacteria bacterium]|nr:dihydropteroate synthase [candidate division Zixibacteria bacterium]